MTSHNRQQSIPSGWQLLTLEKLAIKKGLVRGPFGGALKKEFFVENGYKIYEQKNAIYSSVELGNYFIEPKKFQELKRFSVKGGDFIVSCSGTIGKIFQIPDSAPEGVINQALLKITTDSGIINDRFFFHHFLLPKFQTGVIDSTQGGAMQNLVGMDIFKKTNMIVPPLAEQARIVSVLDTWDWAVDMLKRKIEIKKKVKKGLMQELLTGKRRSVGFKGEWQILNLGDMGKVSMCKRIFQSQTLVQGDIPFFKIGTFGKSPDAFIPKEVYEEYKNNYPFPKKGEILISASGTIGRTVVYDGEPAYFQDSNIVWISNDEKKVLNSFLYYAYKITEWQTDSSTIARLYNDNLRRIKIYAPELKEQKEISNILIHTDNEIDRLEKKLNLLKDQKRYLLNNLVTGTIRTPEKLSTSK